MTVQPNCFVHCLSALFAKPRILSDIYQDMGESLQLGLIALIAANVKFYEVYNITKYKISIKYLYQIDN